MSSAKAINLKVRPLQSVDLCFQVDGVVGDQPDIHLLGKSVTKFDLPGFYATLGQAGAGVPGQLKFDSQAIHAALQPSILFELRAEPIRAALDKALAQRQNSFLQKFNTQPAVIAQMQLIYGGSAIAKGARLGSLATVSQQQHDALHQAYVADNRTVVVKKTTSDTTTDGTDSSVSDTSGNSNSNGTSNSQGSSGSGSSTTPSTGSSTNNDSSTSTSHSNNTSNNHSSSHTDNVGYDYRHVDLENEAQYQRAQVSLLDEQFNHFMFTQNLPFLDTVFNNELKAIDLDVKRLQVAYLDTLLISPIDGVVTGVFRDMGDCVRAGQPVMRVENDKEILLVGTVKYRGLISIGSNFSITTEIYDTGISLTTSGTVVSVRGHDSEDEEWDVLVMCSNRDAHGNPLFPINYNFDFDDTDITITP